MFYKLFGSIIHIKNYCRALDAPNKGWTKTYTEFQTNNQNEEAMEDIEEDLELEKEEDIQSQSGVSTIMK